jgi:hypothetical protein
VVNTTFRPLYPRERDPGIHFTWSWVGCRAGLDGWWKCGLHRDSIPENPSPIELLYKLHYPVPHILKIYFAVLQIWKDKAELVHARHCSDWAKYFIASFRIPGATENFLFCSAFQQSRDTIRLPIRLVSVSIPCGTMVNNAGRLGSVPGNKSYSCPNLPYRIGTHCVHYSMDTWVKQSELDASLRPASTYAVRIHMDSFI